MIGKTVHSLPETPVGAALTAAPALALFALAGVTGVVALAVVGGAFLVLAGFLLVARVPRVTVRFTEAGMQVEQPRREFIPYDAIYTLRPFGRSHDFRKEGKDHFALNVVHEAGTLTLPARLDVPSEDVLQFLDGCLPERADPDLPSALAKHYARQVSLFGEERVTAYATRPHLGYVSSYPHGLVAVGVTLALWVLIAGGVVLMNQGQKHLADVGAALTGVGCFAWFFGGLILLALWSARANGPVRTIRDWRKSGLVISPAGLAMVQGDLKGEMAWEEIRDVKLDTRQRFGIVLHVEGARILIADIYRAPLSHILHKVRDNWREDHGDD